MGGGEIEGRGISVDEKRFLGEDKDYADGLLVFESF